MSLKKIKLLSNEFKSLYQIDDIYYRRFIAIGSKYRKFLLIDLNKYQQIYDIDVNILLRSLIIKYINIKFYNTIYI